MALPSPDVLNSLFPAQKFTELMNPEWPDRVAAGGLAVDRSGVCLKAEGA